VGGVEGLRESRCCLLEGAEVIIGCGRALVELGGSERRLLLRHHEGLLLLSILRLRKCLLLLKPKQLLLLRLCKTKLLLRWLCELLLLRLEKLRLESPLALLCKLLGLLSRLRKHINQVLHILVLLWHSRLAGLETTEIIILHDFALNFLEATEIIGH
jgi:hypothetical protein